MLLSLINAGCMPDEALNFNIIYVWLLIFFLLQTCDFLTIFLYKTILKGWITMAMFNTAGNYSAGVVLLWACLTGSVIANDASTKSDNKKLSAHIVMSHSAGFIGSWLAENKTKELPATRVQKVKKDKRFFAAFLAKGLEGNHADRYKFDVDWKLYKPDGTVMFSESSYARGSGPVPKDPKFSLAYPTLYIVLEKTDPPGKYKLEAIVKDKVTQTSAVDTYLFDFDH